MKKILVAEDEAAIRDFIVINLQRSGYKTVEAENGEEALRIYNEEKDISIAVLDIMMPVIDGLAVCREIRKKSSTTGIIMLTARTQEKDKVNGLMLGADDYITKPFSPSELVARVNSLSRRVDMLESGRQVMPNDEDISIGNFTLDMRRRLLLKDGVPIELTQVELQIIEFFFTHPGVALSRTDILNHVWGDDFFGEEKIVDVNIRRLRMKIEDVPSSPKHIITVWGIGYKWSVI